MIIIVRKINIFLIILVVLLSYMTYSLYTKKSVPVLSLSACNKVIIVDAGHGKPDGGASSKSGVLEKDINLSISKYLQSYIEQGSGIAIITRADDYGIYDSDCTTIRQKKISDLKKRLEIINESSADIFVSIHLNNFSQSQYYGAQVFYSKNNENSKLLAQKIQESLVNNIDNNNTRKIKPAGKDIFLLTKSKIPSVVVECGFLSNPNEAKLLQTKKYQKKVAWCIYIGILEYFNEINNAE